MSSQHPGLSALLERGFVLLDGAQGTELEQRGVNLGGSKLWSAQLLIDDPAMIREVHLDYLRAGSDVITTFTYQASIPGFAAAGVDAAAAAALLNRAVDLAAEAREAFLAERAEAAAASDTSGGAATNGGEVAAAEPPQPMSGRPLIAYSCGSYGGYLADGSEFRGDYAESTSLDQLMEFHRTRLEPVRHRTDIDLLAFETIPCLKEAEAIVALLRRERYGKPAWISFSCRDALHTCRGEGFARDCVPMLAAAAAEGLVAAAGVNCTAPRHVGPLLAAAREQLSALSSVPIPTTTAGGGGALPPPPHSLLLLCYPNSGEDWDGEHRCWRHSPDDISEPGCFARAAIDWVRGPAGVRLVGGCCRTGPGHIRAMRAALAAPAAAGGVSGGDGAGDGAGGG
ncbi:hypothetical protein GPECTOR_4g668 [Gonium pectorale]|uniref:Hcy-binding domain-containing protein n=1 Tax=Gonium pectorale TaxID=33097 RepID=A0A150GXX0_GONPE|nr:hypothetical protein GPECTOR_4g668 [Gonium pectorale]|eukprot:KXZ54603.1 hypothetical protein GPECTOR_4g668 [Gonium pectorale]